MKLVKISRRDGSRLRIDSVDEALRRMALHLGCPVEGVVKMLNDCGGRVLRRRIESDRTGALVR